MKNKLLNLQEQNQDIEDKNRYKLENKIVLRLLVDPSKEIDMTSVFR